MNKALHSVRGTAIAIALAAACGAGSAHAQSQVTVYGLIDAALVHTDNVDAAGHSVTKMPSLTGSLPSRIGFRGSEKLGGGLAAVFTLESGFNPDVGTLGQGGRISGRQAWVGLRGRWGTLQLGRILNMTYLATAKSDVLGPKLFSINSIDLYLPNARSDNAIGYIGAFDRWTAGATWSFSRDASAAGGPSATGCAGEVPGNARGCRQYITLLGYNAQTYGFVATYDKLFGNTGAAGGLTSSANFDRRTIVNGYAMFKGTKIGAGMIDRKTLAATDVTESDLYYLGASAPLTAMLALDAQVARLTYASSGHRAMYAGIGRMDNHGAAVVALDAGGTTAAGKTQNGVMLGLRRSI